MKHLFFCILTVLFGANLSAQKLSVPTTSLITEQILPKADYLFQDSEEKVLFIDFGKLNDGIHSLEILDKSGASILEKDVKSSRNDAIIEIDYKNFKEGFYNLILLKEDKTIETSFNISS
jgi:hypothetical protein